MTPDQLVDLAIPLVVAGAGYRMWRDSRATEIGKPVLPPVGKAGIVDRFWHPLIEPINVGDARIEFFETHMRLLAMSGGFKTTLLADLVRQRIKRGRPVVVLTGGDSAQIETEILAAGGFVIRPQSSPLRFNAFEGSPAFMAQTWAQLMPTSSVAKVQHGAFEQAALEYFKSTTRYSVQGLKDFCMQYEPDDDGKGSRAIWKGMRENYLTIRLQRVEEFLGDWIGDELSISDCVERKVPVMFVIDSKDWPDLYELCAALVFQGMCYAIDQHGKTTGLDAFIDEFGRLPQGLVGNPVRTWRFLKSHLVAASHTDRDFEDDEDDILEDLFHVNILGRMVGSATRTRKAASEMTWGVVHPTAFGPHALGKRRTRLDVIRRAPRQGYFWVVDQERVQEVKVFTYRAPKNVKSPQLPHRFLASVRPDRVSGQASGTGGGVGATWKGRRPEMSTGDGGPDVPPRTPIAEGSSGLPGEARIEDAGPRQGPVEPPPIFFPPFATKNELRFWLRHRFPTGPDGDWDLDFYCNPETGRPETTWRGSPFRPLPPKQRTWMAYMVVQVLWDIYNNGWVLDSKEAADYIWEIKEQTRAMKRTIGHRDDICHSTKCGRGSHIRWISNRQNVIEQIESRRKVQELRRPRERKLA